MAELPAYLFQRSLERTSTGAGGRGVPARQGIGDVAGGARGQAAVGDALIRAGQVVADIDARFRRAKEVTDLAEGLSAGIQAAENTSEAIQVDKTIQSRDWASHFAKSMEEQTQALLEPYSDRVRAQIKAQLAPRIAATQRALFTTGREKFITQALQGIHTVLAQLQRQELTATDEVDIARIHASQQAIIDAAVESGLFSVGEGAATAQKLREGTKTVKLQTFIRTSPEAALLHLENVAQGKQGIEGLPIPDPKDLPKLIDDAQEELRQQLNMESALERQENAQRETRSENLRAQLIEKMIDARDNPRELQGLLDTAQVSRQGGELLGKDDEVVQRFGLQLINADVAEQRDTTDPAVLKQYFRHLLEEPKAAAEFVIDHTGRGLGVGSAASLFGHSRTAMHDNHFRNLREVKDAIAFVEDQLGTTGDPMLDAVVSVELSGIKSDAILELLTRVQGVAGIDGLEKNAVLEALPIIRDEIVQTHRARLKAVVQGLPSTVGVPQTLSIKDAVRQWKGMIQRGVTKYEADAFLGREIARHSAAVAPEDRAANLEAIAAELEQAMKELQ